MTSPPLVNPFVMGVLRPSSISYLSTKCPSGSRIQQMGTKVCGPIQRPPHRSSGSKRGRGRRGSETRRTRAACVALRDMLAAFVFCVTHLLCFFLLLFLPALRTHNLTVLPSRNSAFVSANDSAYSNLSATVGEHVSPSVPPSVVLGSAVNVKAGSIWFCVSSLSLGWQTHTSPRQEQQTRGLKNNCLGQGLKGASEAPTSFHVTRLLQTSWLFSEQN